jgi:hypothetical protein
MIVICFVVTAACSKTERAPDLQKPTPASTVPVTSTESWGPNLAEKPTFLAGVERNYGGIVSALPQQLSITKKPLPELSPEQMDFYQKYAGIYASDSLISSKSLPLTNLAQIEMSWGTDYYFITDAKSIDFNSKSGKFVFSSGDRAGEISDIANYKLEPGWTRISAPADPGAFLKTYIADRSKVLTDNRPSELSENEKATIWKFVESAMAAIRYLDEAALRQMISSQYGVSFNAENAYVIHTADTADAMKSIESANKAGNFSYVDEPARLLSLFGSDEERFLQEKMGFKVAIDQFINRNPSTFQNDYPGGHLIEIEFSDTNEFFGFGVIKENNELKLCFVENGTSDL